MKKNNLMQINWLVEKDVFNENLARLQKEVESQGHIFVPIEYTPVLTDKHMSILKPSDCVIFYGSLSMMRQIERYAPWFPGGWCNLPNFRCTEYYTHFGQYLLNQEYFMVTLSELIRRKSYYCNLINPGGGIFVRPNSGAKEFTGIVLQLEEINAENLGFGFYHEDRSLLLVVAKQLKDADAIRREWRLVICNKKVIAWSQYKINYELEVSSDCPKEVIDFANQIASEPWEPDPIYVIDIGQNKDGLGLGLGLIEINAFSTSALYDCDVRPVVEAASALAMQEWDSVGT
jgi:hypothetical protein